MKKLALLEGRGTDNPVLAEIQQDLQHRSSILELMKSYMEQLEGKTDNNARPFIKLNEIFLRGIAPVQVEGHHYGVALGIKTGEGNGIWTDYSNILGLLWSTSLGKVPPWVGKTFRRTNKDDLTQLTEGYEKGDTPTYSGINHFNEIEQSVLNTTSLLFLSFWLNLRQAPSGERARYGYEKIGGNFVARSARSVYKGTDRDVFQLNYRWGKLANLPPLSYLIDEIVEISPGIYLGQLLFATKRLLDEYEPGLPPIEYGYQHFGYFLLMDERWRTEARKQFPLIGIPADDIEEPPATPKFTTFTFADPAEGALDEHLMAQIREDMKGKETILDLLKSYSDELIKHPALTSPAFARLHELFNRGIAPREVKGYFRGALVTWWGEKFLGIFDVNVLNFAWRLARSFSPWTGKTFEDLDLKHLAEFTNGNETGQLPTFWGANTYSERTTRKKLVVKAMKAARIWTEDASSQENSVYGYDLKSFFFIARQSTSIYGDNKGKKVFQFNYRWPRLKSFPPDNLCIDEIVQIAEGLYLGQLIYATKFLKKYDPSVDPSLYKYGIFGYFLLMDEEWHRRRLKIGFDTDNT